MAINTVADLGPLNVNGSAPAPITVIGSTNSGPPPPWVSPDQWDSVNIGGTGYGWAYSQFNPALVGSKVRIIGAKRKYKIEVKLPQGSDGSINTYRGVHVSPFDIVFFIVTPAQYSYFVTNMLPVLKFSGVKNAPNPAVVQSQAVYHPILNALDIDALLVEEIGGIDPKEDGPNEFTCKVRCVEYLPPPSLNTTVTPGGISGTNQPTSAGMQTPTALSQHQSSINNQILQVGDAGF
jgi:hypothetical protein